VLFKNVPSQVKDLDVKQGIFTGYFSVFNTQDDGEPPDIVVPGAFQKTFAELGPASTKPRIKCLMMHDPFALVGKPLVLSEHDYGAYHETKLASTSMGKDALALLEEGIITEMSFGYDAIKAPFDKQRGVRFLKEVKCWEYSLVTWGMHSGTMVTGTKSADPSQMANQMARLEKMLKRGNLQSEDLLEGMELALKQWRAQVKELEIKAQETPTPTQETIVVVTPATDEKGGTETMDPKNTPAPTEAKAPDFQSILTQATTEENLRNEWWLLIDAVRGAIRGVLKDTTITDKSAAATTSLDQFKTAMLSWVVRAAAVNLWSDQAKAADFLASMETKSGGPTDSKEGRMLSDANRKKINDTLAALSGAAESLQALLTAAEPAAKATPDPKEPPKATTEPGETTPVADQVQVTEIKTMLAGIRAEMKGVTQ
jgi:HK97 family phage prohead protease